jgi:hypothetical protein
VVATQDPLAEPVRVEAQMVRDELERRRRAPIPLAVSDASARVSAIERESRLPVPSGS